MESYCKSAYLAYFPMDIRSTNLSKTSDVTYKHSTNHHRKSYPHAYNRLPARNNTRIRPTSNICHPFCRRCRTIEYPTGKLNCPRWTWYASPTCPFATGFPWCQNHKHTRRTRHRSTRILYGMVMY